MEIKITGEIKLTADAALLGLLDRLTTLTAVHVPAGALNGVEGPKGPLTVEPTPEPQPAINQPDAVAAFGSAMVDAAIADFSEKQAAAVADSAPVAPEPQTEATPAPEPVAAEPAPEPQLAPTQAPASNINLTTIRSAVLPLVQNGKQPELKAVLEKYGVQSITALPKETWTAFAADIRAMGAEI